MKQRSTLSRRDFIRASTATAIALPFATSSTMRVRAAEKAMPINIGSRRELFVDDYLIASMTRAQLRLHKPEPSEVVLVCDRPWEGNTSAYYTLFQDEDRFRAYYRGSHFNEETRKSAHPGFACYAESRDGIKWEKPELGLFEFKGSKQNNIVWAGPGTHNFTPFEDGNPAGTPNARYKALAGGDTTVKGKMKRCLDAYQSADGIHWTLMAGAVITAGAFDSQNLAFWDAERGEYRAYWRIFTAGFTDEHGWKPAGQRAIRTASSKDFIHWTNQADLTYEDSPPEHLYTNTVMPYFRAPHLFIGFPTRFQPKTQQVEPVLMTSRDGVRFRRWSEALIPITAPQDRDGNRSNYMTWGLLQVPGNDRELSVYATEGYYTGRGSRVRRFTFRTDGFASAHAPANGELITKPLRFAGKTLEINCRTASNGTVRVEIQDVAGKPLPGFTLAGCRPMSGDHIAQIVTWKNDPSVGTLAGQRVRMRFAMEDAELFSLKFNP